ncbi:MAG: hypothetical protein AAGC93_30755 [Cyanobacteria bacterium P01_F01_bin.53]
MVTPPEKPDKELEKKPANSQVKIVATLLILSVLALTIWQLIAPLPRFLQPVFAFTQVILIIHAVEGVIATVFIGLYKLRTTSSSDSPPSQAENSLLMEKLPDNTALAIIKAGLYAFFVGTVGLVEIIQATKTSAESSKA